MPRNSQDPRDIEIGKRVRAMRLQRGLSQTELGEYLNVSFQQVQKYERGANRISAGRLQLISDLLKVPITFFFTGLEGGSPDPGGAAVDSEFSLLQTGGAVRLLRAYSRIPDGKTRGSLVSLAETIAGEPPAA
jgi:transcriptional regulator with XRE-family HTH domain